MPPRDPHAVVVTGRGAVSALGDGVAALWSGLTRGLAAIAPAAGFAAGDLSPNRVAEVLTPAVDDPDRAGAFAVHVARAALADAGLDPARSRVGVALGTTLGGMRLFEHWLDGETPLLASVPYYAPAVRVARAFGCRGPVATPQLACASGTYAIALATDWIRTGQADVVLAGGTDLLCRFVVSGFNCLRATAEQARPFDVHRRGLVLGEGAAVLVIESAEHARGRGAAVQARVTGVGAAADATHMTAPDRQGRGAERAMRAALAEARRAPAAIDFVSAHGTGTVYNDAMEAVALERLFGPGAVPVNSIKGAIGHTLGAAGALEAVMCVDVLRTGTIPATVGLGELDPVCAGIDVVAGEPRPCAARAVVSTSSGFAGANAALVLEAP
jgi:3-oxoacyl-[acyl-carrier-protein] synthase II